MDLTARLSYLFGSEEYVDMRRQLVLWKEEFGNYSDHEKQIRIICSGSLGEGVAYPMSDEDIMLELTNNRVVKTYREATRRDDLLMVPSEFSPGYCLLLDVTGSHSDNLIHIMNGMPFLSSILLKKMYIREGEIIHGPCQSGYLCFLEYDYAFCIFCYTWPDVANEWICRKRFYAWPSNEMIEKIVQNGCHVVPVGDPDSPYGQHEWRISFSIAERTLMHSYNHAQFLVYNLLRLTLKRIIGKNAPDVLCSYFMKTTLFYTAENTGLEFWRVDNLERCFRTCLSVLYDYVYHTYCPNYFIPEYNMIKRKIDHSNRHQMLDIIRYVYDIGIIGVIHVSGESVCLVDSLSARMIECNLDREFFFSRHLENVFADISPLYDNLCHGDIERCLYVTYNIFRSVGSILAETENGIMKYLLNKGIIDSCQHILHHLCISEEGNKRDYSRGKRFQYLLRQGYNGDVTTGKLTMATYTYMIGKTESALTIIRHLLSEFPPYALDRYIDNIKVTTYIDVMCGRGYNIAYKAKRAFAPSYFVSCQRLNAFPYPLRIWISLTESFLLDPLTYTFFLQWLCYVQQRNQCLLKKPTICLVNHINDLRSNLQIANARMCVGIIKFVQCDHQSACRWMGSVYIIKDTLPQPYNKRFSLSALTYISCLLNKQFQT